MNQMTTLPKGFVEIIDVDPSIILEPRYYGHDNFIGQPIDGYASSKVFLSHEATKALEKAHSIFKKDGYTIVVYDAYRPQCAMDHFHRWGKDLNDHKMKEWFYPRITKSEIFSGGYIGNTRSSHSRGSTLDLTLIPTGKKVHKIIPEKRRLQDGSEFTYLNDGTLDMGCSFDLFDLASYPVTNLITDDQQRNRNYLRNVLESCGFKVFPEEWWHYTLIKEPFPDTYFEFKIS